MKLTKKIGIACLTAGLCLSIGIGFLGSDKVASADQKVLTTISDNFEKANIDRDTWTVKNVNLYKTPTARARIYAGEWDTGLGYRGYRVQKDCTISFEIAKAGTLGTNFWIGLALGNSSPSNGISKSRSCVYSNYNINGISQTCCMVYEKDFSQLNSATSDAREKFAGVSPLLLLNDGNTVTCEYKLVKTGVNSDNQNLYSVTAYFYETGREKSTGTTAHYENLVVEGYAGIMLSSNSGGANVDITNFKIDDGTVVTDDFSDPKKWNNTFTKGRAHVGTLHSLNLNVANGMVLSKTKLKKSSDNDLQFELSVNLKADGVQKANNAYGIGLGLPDGATRADQTNFIGLVPLNNAEFSVVVVKNGSVSHTFTEKVSFSEFDRYNGIAMKLTQYCDRTQIKVGKHTYETAGIEYDGSFALASVGLDGNQSGMSMLMDDFSFKSYAYATQTETESVAFKAGGSKVVGKEEDLEIKEYYLNDSKWYSTNVTLPKYNASNPREFLTFAATKDNAGFGYKKQVGEFIARASFYVNEKYEEIENGGLIGIGFANSTTRMSKNTASGVYFYNDKRTEKAKIRVYDQGSMKAEFECDVNVFKLQGKSNLVSVRCMAVGNSVEFSYSVNGQTQTVRYDGVKTYGYAGFITSYTAVNMTEFALTNINRNATNADKDKECFNAPAQTIAANDKVETNVGYDGGIAYYAINGGASDYYVTVGEHKIKIGANGITSDTLTVKENHFTALPTGNYTLYLYACNQEIKVGILPEGKIEDSLYDTVVSFTSAESVNGGKIGVCADAAQVQIGGVKVYTLANRLTAYYVEDYKETDTTRPVKPLNETYIPPEIDGEKEEEGCGSSIEGMGTTLGLVTLSALGAFAIKKRKERRE